MTSDAYAPIRAETSSSNEGSLRYTISDIPISWQIGAKEDFCVVGISADGAVVERVEQSYLSFDDAEGTLTISPLFGTKDFCVYVFRDEEAANLFSIKADGNANIASILAQFEKDTRILKQLMALSLRTLRTPDEMGILPDASFRAGKVLTFDNDGAPSVLVSAADVLNVKTYMNAALAAKTAAESARDAAVVAKTGAESAVSGFDDHVGDKKDELDIYEESKEAELAAYALVKVGEFDANVTAKTGAFNTNAAAKQALIDAAVAEADAAAEAAAGAQEVAEDFKDEAATAATAARLAEQNVTATVAGQLAQIEAAKEEALGEIAAVVDPNGLVATQTTRIDELQRRANFVKFITGYGQIKNTPARAEVPLSVCLTYRIVSAELSGAANIPFLAVGDIAYDNCLNFGSHTGNTGFALQRGQYRVALATNAHKAALKADGKFHTLVGILTESGGAIYHDGVALTSTFSTVTVSAGSAPNWYICKDATASIKADIARLKIFNNDITAADSPYTLLEYVIGLDEHPAQSGALLAQSGSSTLPIGTGLGQITPYAASSYYTLAYNGSNRLVFTSTRDGAGYTILGRVILPKTIPAGSVVRVKLGAGVSSSAYQVRYLITLVYTDGTTSGTLGYIFASAGVIQAGAGLLTASKPVKEVNVGVGYITGGSWLNGDTLEFGEMYIESLGAVASFGKTSNSASWTDASGNGAHMALYEGVISSAHEQTYTVYARHTWDAATGAYIIKDGFILPANSEITILGKAAANGNWNIGSSSTTATAYATAKAITTAWTELVKFYTSTASKLYFTPPTSSEALDLAIKINKLK